jgi:orotidine-5'-phosphate decarboxylase
MAGMIGQDKMLSDRVIIALDAPGFDAAAAIVEKLGDFGTFYKVGLELYIRDGDRAIKFLRAAGKKVFLDLKLHDIPNTVAGAVKSIATKGAMLTTIHTTGGHAMMRAAREALDSSCADGLKLLGVTVLTSIDEDTLRDDLLNQTSIPKLVPHLALIAREAGMHGVVASALELSLLRERLGDEFLIVTPGIRPAGADVADQKRVVTPRAAFDRGASCIVVGRPVTAAPDPASAMKAILDEIA